MATGTVTQKIIDSHIVSGMPKKSESIQIRIDQTLTQDATGTMAYLELEAMNIERVKTKVSVSYVDHNTQQNGPENRNDHLYLQSIAAAKGLFFSRPGNGICHQVHLERFGAPGETLLGSDSHTPTNGGLGMIAIGAGGLDVALAMAGKPFKITYPEIVGIELTGCLHSWVSAKDIILKVLSLLTTKGNVGRVIEYFGEGVSSLTVPERATITNMGAELGVTTSIFPSDEQTKLFLEAQERKNAWREIVRDTNATYDKVIKINLNQLEPLAACPSSPDNIKTVNELSGMPVNQVLIGSCTNSSVTDLMLVSEILKNKTISPNVTLSIAPGSKQVLEIISKNGVLTTLISSGARILESACGPCIGQGQSPEDGAVSVRTFNRNFLGRTGTKNDKAYLVSPATAALAALYGKFISINNSLSIPFPQISIPRNFDINDNMIIPPLSIEESIKINIVRKPTISSPPVNTSLPNKINGKVIIKVADKITTDHIMPAGIYLKYRSNIPKYSKYVFECFNNENKIPFYQRAEEAKTNGYNGIIVAGESYGQGSSREHAAICPMYLGIKVVIALSFERIHTANLINFGIIPLLFTSKNDYQLIEEDELITIENIYSNLKPLKTITANIGSSSINLAHNLSEEDIKIILAGGVLNLK